MGTGVLFELGNCGAGIDVFRMFWLFVKTQLGWIGCLELYLNGSKTWVKIFVKIDI